MKTGIKKQNKITEITFDEKDNRIFICTYNTDLKNRLTKYAEKYPDKTAGIFMEGDVWR